MPREAAQILHEALELPPEQRAALADCLLNSLDTDVDAELNRRGAKKLNGASSLFGTAR